MKGIQFEPQKSQTYLLQAIEAGDSGPCWVWEMLGRQGLHAWAHRGEALREGVTLSRIPSPFQAQPLPRP